MPGPDNLPIFNQFVATIRNHDVAVVIIGVGYVELPLALRFGEVGSKVVGYQSSPKMETSKMLLSMPSVVTVK